MADSINPHNPITTIHKIISHHKDKTPNANSILYPERPPLIYQELFNQILYVAQTLNSLNITNNDRVATVIPNGPEMATAFLSISSCSVCAPLRPSYNEKEFEFYLKDTNAKALVTVQDLDTPAIDASKKLGLKILKLSPQVNEPVGTFQFDTLKPQNHVTPTFSDENNTALILHTSGTTARPKIVPLTHKNLTTSANNIMNTLCLRPSDKCLNIMPLFHIHGLIGAVLSSISAGASIICTSGFNVNTFFEHFYEQKPTWYSAVPTMHYSILRKAQEAGVKKTNLRFIRSSSQALPPKIMNELEDVFKVPVIESYGMTEAAHQMASNPLPPGIRKPGSVGKSAGPEIAIMNEKGVILSQEEIGEIVIRGPSVISAYENNDEANEKSFINRWFRTGDQGYLDLDNYLYVTGRIKEIINRGGEKISPREIDEILLDHPDIKDALAFSVPHEILGETIGVAIVLEDESQLKSWDVQHHIAKRLGDDKVPEKVLFLDTIPKGATGKVQRIGLAEKLGINEIKYSEIETVEPSPPSNIIESQIQEIWSEVLRIPNVGVNQNYFHLGGDSILAAAIIAQMVEKMRLENFKPVVFLHAPTIMQMAGLIENGKIKVRKTDKQVNRLNKLFLKLLRRS